MRLFSILIVTGAVLAVAQAAVAQRTTIPMTVASQTLSVDAFGSTSGEAVEWEIVNVEGAEFICFTTRFGAIDCSPTFGGLSVGMVANPRETNPGPPRERIKWEIVDVEGAEFVCFTARRGTIDCHVLTCPGWDPGEGPRPIPAECSVTRPGPVIE
jgi:hypothetical protein